MFKVKKQIRLVLLHAMLYANRRPKLKRVAVFGLIFFPALKMRLKQLSTRQVDNLAQGQYKHVVKLSPRAQKIHAELKEAIGKDRKSH